MRRLILHLLWLATCLSLSSCSRNSLALVEWDRFRELDIHVHSSPYDIMQKIHVPHSSQCKYLLLKIYPIKAPAPKLLVGFFRDNENKPGETPFLEVEMVVAKREGSFEYAWSVDASYVNIESIPRGGDLWLGFRDSDRPYNQLTDYSYNSQIVVDGQVESTQGNYDYSGIITTGLTYVIAHEVYLNKVIPYGFAESVGEH